MEIHSEVISSFSYRSCEIRVNKENGWPIYTAFRLKPNGLNQILTTWGFREPLGVADPAYQNYLSTILVMPSRTHIREAIDRIIANEAYTELSDRTGKEYKKLMDAARGDVNRDELWAAACQITGFKNTRKNSNEVG